MPALNYTLIHEKSLKDGQNCSVEVTIRYKVMKKNMFFTAKLVKNLKKVYICTVKNLKKV